MVAYHDKVLGITVDIPHTRLDKTPYERPEGERDPRTIYETDFDDMDNEIIKLANSCQDHLCYKPKN